MDKWKGVVVLLSLLTAVITNLDKIVDFSQRFFSFPSTAWDAT